MLSHKQIQLIRNSYKIIFEWKLIQQIGMFKVEMCHDQLSLP